MYEFFEMSFTAVFPYTKFKSVIGSSADVRFNWRSNGVIFWPFEIWDAATTCRLCPQVSLHQADQE